MPLHMLMRRISAFTAKYSARNITEYARAYSSAYRKNLACSAAIHFPGSSSGSRRATMTWSSRTVSPEPVARFVEPKLFANPAVFENDAALLW